MHQCAAIFFLVYTSSIFEWRAIVFNRLVKKYQRVLEALDYQDSVYDRETTLALLEQVARFCQHNVMPTNELGDREGLIYDPKDHSVKVPKCYHEVVRSMKEMGYWGLSMPEEYGGGNAPKVVSYAVMEFIAAANFALSTYPLLTHGVTSTVLKYGSETLIKQYVPAMISGSFSGTMCLTESHCGTDLGLLRSTAKPVDGGYEISGNKIWITFGEHDLSDNIIHLVLARLPDAPDGVKGISMFLVPKFLQDGSRNAVFCGGLEHKMGSNGSPTCVMNFDKAMGWLVGEPHRGLVQMFNMMNAARLFVGVQGLALSDLSYEYALLFAQERRQSKSLSSDRRDTEQSADIILVHPDVRRMLLDVRSINEPMRALAVYAALVDERGDNDRLGLLTPVIKSFLTDQGMVNVSTSLQLMGGMGYTREGRVEQLYRDGRITLIYEGTNGIQALDLVGRKLMKNNGAALLSLVDEMKKAAELSGPFNAMLSSALTQLTEANAWLMKNGLMDPEEGASVAPHYLNIFALTLCCYMWVKLGQEESLRAFGSHFQTTHFPRISYYLTLLKSGKKTLFDLEDKDF